VTSAVNVNDLLDGHLALDIECVDRIYLNAYNCLLTGSVRRHRRAALLCAQ